MSPSKPTGTVSSTAARHRWPGAGTVISPNKTERECRNGCGIVKVTRHETEGGRDLHWIEFWRGLDPISDVNGRTPPCTGPATAAVSYSARNYPL